MIPKRGLETYTERRRSMPMYALYFPDFNVVALSRHIASLVKYSQKCRPFDAGLVLENFHIFQYFENGSYEGFKDLLSFDSPYHEKSKSLYLASVLSRSQKAFLKRLKETSWCRAGNKSLAFETATKVWKVRENKFFTVTKYTIVPNV